VTALLEGEGLTRRHQVHGAEVVALAPVTLAVAPGESVAVTGPSGSGKSTLLALLAGWDRPSTGSVRRSAPATVFLPQRVSLVEELTVRDNLALARREPVPDAEVVATAEALGVTALLDRFPSQASLGERQRVGVARCLLTGAAVLLLDEPTAHQDAVHQRLVLSAVAPPADRAVVLSTHDADVAAWASRELRLAPARG